MESAPVRFQVELVLPGKGMAVVARQLDPGRFSPGAAALLGEHMILAVQPAPAPDGKPRADLWVFRLELDEAHPRPTPGEILEITTG